VRLADDRRGRVPFALVGILLLVGSAAFATSLSTTGASTLDRRPDAAVDRVTAGSQSALRAAVRDAAREAAATPVTAPADTPVGRALDPEEPFRDALRLRIYVAARERLATTTYRHGEITATASLPAPPDTTAGAKRAIDRIGLAAGNGSALQVTVRNVSVIVRRDGREVRRERRTTSLTVDAPVLAMHDRTRRFEQLLNRGPLAGPGLGRQLTARLYPIVWARAYAQYGGVPIQNVLANRHVELATNGGVLAAQRRAFGRADPGGREARYRAAACTGLREVLAPYERDRDAWVRQVLDAASADAASGDAADADGVPCSAADVGSFADLGPLAESGVENRTTVVGVNRTADRVLGSFVRMRREGPAVVGGLDHVASDDGSAADGTGSEDGGRAVADRSLDGLLRAGYRADLRVRTAVRRVERESRPAPAAPGPNWTLVDSTVETTADTTAVGDGAERAPDATGEWHALYRSSHRVTVEHTVRRTWKRGPQTQRTSATWHERSRVGVTLVARHDPPGLAPDNRTDPAFRRGGAVDGPNLADLRDRGENLLARWGGPASIATRAARGSLDRTQGSAVGQRPDRLRAWILSDLREFRDRIRNVNVTVPSERVASGTANPPARLADRLRERRGKLLAAPASYNGVADRTRVAARVAYLDRVLARLDERANRTERAGSAFEAAIDRARNTAGNDRAATGPGRARIAAARDDAATPAPNDSVGTGPVGGLSIVPEGSPTYLPLGNLDGDRFATVPDDERRHVLAARNVNVFSVPYGDAADSVLDQVLGNDAGSRRVRVRTAARALVVANWSLARERNATVRTRRERLRRNLASSLAGVRRAASRAVAAESPLGREEARDVVADAFGRWDGVGHRALAAANGSAARRIVDRTERRAEPDPGVALSVRVRAAVDDAVHAETTRLDRSVVDDLATAVQASGRVTLERALEKRGKAAAEEVVEDATRRHLGRTVTAVPAGLPIAPVPGYWYATANAWVVSVRGSYESFTVRSRRGSPTGGAFRYVRDGTNATLDVDGDGGAELLGRGERVAFEANTTVVVAVPAGKTGLGDVDGDADERSEGWSSLRNASRTGPGGGDAE